MCIALSFQLEWSKCRSSYITGFTTQTLARHIKSPTRSQRQTSHNNLRDTQKILKNETSSTSRPLLHFPHPPPHLQRSSNNPLPLRHLSRHHIREKWYLSSSHILIRYKHLSLLRLNSRRKQTTHPLKILRQRENLVKHRHSSNAKRINK